VLLRWLRQLASGPSASELRWVVPAHYDAPVPASAQGLAELADAIESRPWATDAGNWAYLARLDHLLLKAGVVPERPAL
jgi:hypothetical protein